MLKALKKLGKINNLNKDNERIYKLSLILALFVICIGIELQVPILRTFWENKNIKDPFDRLDFLIEHYPSLIDRGPIVEMAIMANTQLLMPNSKSRGLIFDCLHSLYCYYVHNTITADEHFKLLKSQTIYKPFNRIIMTEEIIKIWELTKGKMINSKNS